MGTLHDSSQNQHTDEIPISISRWNTGELERRQSEFFQSMSGDGRYFDPNDAQPETDPSLPVVNPLK